MKAVVILTSRKDQGLCNNLLQMVKRHHDGPVVVANDKYRPAPSIEHDDVVEWSMGRAWFWARGKFKVLHETMERFPQCDSVVCLDSDLAILKWDWTELPDSIEAQGFARPKADRWFGGAHVTSRNITRVLNDVRFGNDRNEDLQVSKWLFEAIPTQVRFNLGFYGYASDRGLEDYINVDASVIHLGQVPNDYSRKEATRISDIWTKRILTH